MSTFEVTPEQKVCHFMPGSKKPNGWRMSKWPACAYGLKGKSPIQALQQFAPYVKINELSGQNSQKFLAQSPKIIFTLS